ncbi:uncharacterized protein isoform X2 [Musca autumnalis]|uniref:uncharacterized protein isoform X2 n=1 Tax=Musca autumnalis TaxID=221902 RepID=UPI003CEB17DD
MAKILNYQNSHKLKAVVEHQRHHQREGGEGGDEEASLPHPLTPKIGCKTFSQTFHCLGTQQPSQYESQHIALQHGRSKQQQHYPTTSCRGSSSNKKTNKAQLLPQLTTTAAAADTKMPTQHLQQQEETKNNYCPMVVEPASKTYNSATSLAPNNCSSPPAPGPISAISPSPTSSSPSSSSLYLPQLWPSSSTLYSNYSCCVLTYNLFAAYAEAATLQLKRKTSLTKLFYAASCWSGAGGGGAAGFTSLRRHNDMSSICYLILMAFVYWGVMIRAAVATNLSNNATTSSASNPIDATTIATSTQLNASMENFQEITNKNFLPNSKYNNNNNKFFALFAKEKEPANASQPTNVISNNITTSTSLSQMNKQLPFLSLTSSSSSASFSPSSSSLSSSSSSSPVSLDILSNYQRRLLTRREAANVPDFEDDDSSYHDDDLDEYETLIRNKSAKGKYIGAPCNNMSCEPTLLHVTCDKETQICGCERGYPVQIGLTRGCDKPKKLGEMCFFDETCQFNDENSLCVQVRHNAMCQCVKGYHSVSLNKPTRRVFCTPDLDELNSDLPTLLGVCVGIGVLAGLICMVLHLFSKTKYPRHRNFGDANLPPPIMYSSETVQSGRPSSRSSIRSSGGSIGSYGNRRSSTGGVTSTTAGSKGILVSTSRTGSRRPSLASVHSTSSSVRSYSMMRFEKEQQQKEIRHEMKLRLARLQQHQQQQQLGQYKPQIIIGDTAMTMQQHGVAMNRITMATPSPMTPNSTDELLPAVDENSEYPPAMELQQQQITTTNRTAVASATISAIKQAATGSQSTTTTMGASPKQTSTTTNMTTTGKATSSGAATTTAAAATAAASSVSTDIANAAAYIGPCSSSTEAL